MNTNLPDILLNCMHLQPGECAGKVVVVTGAGRGIGRHTAEAFALLGARVVIAELSEQGQTAADEICRAGGRACWIQTDVSDYASVDRLTEKTRTIYGAADMVINNAIRIAVAPVAEMEVQLWDEIISVNLRGTFLVSRAFMPDLLATKGILINMISTEAMPGLAAYIASKQGILGLTQSLALEAGPAGVRVIPFGPGMVDTPGIRSVAEELAPRLGLKHEQFLNLSLHTGYDGMMPPEHAGAAAAFLALRLADAYHGQEVNGYEVLEQAGLLAAAGAAEMLAVATPLDNTPACDSNVPELAQQVREIITETGKEFEKLPAFVRPLARNGFKSKSGASLDAWQKELSALALGERAHPTLASRLEKLIVYYQGVPAETARFTRDKAVLAAIQQTCSHRITLIQSLIQAVADHRPLL